MLTVIVVAPLVMSADSSPFFEENISLSPDKYRLCGALENYSKLQRLFVLMREAGFGRDYAHVFLTHAANNRVMDRRLVTIACIIAILISVTVFFIFSRPITGTWVCTDRLTEHSLLTDEVTIITLRQDGTTDFRSYQTYLTGRYHIRDGSGTWEPAGFGKYRITIMQGIDSSCSHFENCTLAAAVPFDFIVDHDQVRDTIAYDPQGAPEFTSIRPFVRSIVLDCSKGCPGY